MAVTTSPTRAAKAGAVRDRSVGSAGPLVALVGPPNSGKTTLYNQLTGLRQKVANYPGVTVEKHVGRARLPNGGEITVVDLPGVNGFSARTQDERVTRDVLEGRVAGVPSPDALVLVVDSTRLEAQLMLVDPVLEFKLPTLLVLNMSDELVKRGGDVDDEALAHELGVEVVRANARAGTGLDKVQAFLQKVLDAEHAFAAMGATKPPRVPHSPRRADLPVVDVFVTRRGRTKVVAHSRRASVRHCRHDSPSGSMQCSSTSGSVHCGSCSSSRSYSRRFSRGRRRSWMVSKRS